MRRTFGRVVAVALLATGTLGSAAMAQPPFPGGGGGPGVSPPFSPYLNLLRRDNPTYLNYFGLVQPQQNFQQSIQMLNQNVMGATMAANQATTTNGLAGTGHAAYFMNTQGYFLTVGAGIGSLQRPNYLRTSNIRRPGVGGTSTSVGGMTSGATPYRR
jgi:hypothetical protein